jgi:hypothetical protein
MECSFVYSLFNIICFSFNKFVGIAKNLCAPFWLVNLHQRRKLGSSAIYIISVQQLLIASFISGSLLFLFPCRHAFQSIAFPLLFICCGNSMLKTNGRILLQVHLIEGIIDQVEGTVHVSWVQPRVLGIPQIKSLRDRLDNWLKKVNTALKSIEAETPDLVAS